MAIMMLYWQNKAALKLRWRGWRQFDHGDERSERRQAIRKSAVNAPLLLPAPDGAGTF
jgi:hypothetical protein